MRVIGTALAGLASGCLVLSGCSSADRTPAHHTAASRPAPKPADLSGRLLRRTDLPAGFVTRPLTGRNLPSGLAGCDPLGRLIAADVVAHEQAEFFRLPFGPWIDEAVIAPARDRAADLSARLAGAIGGCGSVTVTEEGYRVTLRLTPASPAGLPSQARAFQGDGRFHGIRLSMQAVLLPAGDVVLLVTNTALGRAINPGLGALAVRAAAGRAVPPGSTG